MSRLMIKWNLRSGGLSYSSTTSFDLMTLQSAKWENFYHARTLNDGPSRIVKLLHLQKNLQGKSHSNENWKKLFWTFFKINLFLNLAINQVRGSLAKKIIEKSDSANFTNKIFLTKFLNKINPQEPQLSLKMPHLICHSPQHPPSFSL